MIRINNLANVITISRIVCAVMLMFTTPFSWLFWSMYIYCGVSDIIDGKIARIMKQQSNFGAKLDSIADTIFVFSVIITIVSAVVIPSWLWTCVVIIMFVRVTAYLIGYKKHHTFSALHTYANKATGLLLFCSPILIYVLGITASSIILCVLAFLSSCEELLITILSKDLNRNGKSFLTMTEKL